MKNEWLTYYNSTKDNPPSETAIKAAEQFGEAKGQVIDLGCGAGVDALYFLSKGWKVLAVDAHAEYLSEVRAHMPEELRSKLEVQEMSFEHLAIERPVDCITANFSLPFCNPLYFDTMWKEIVRGLKPEGIFCGVFFGDRDDWAKWARQERCFHSLPEVKELFAEFEILDLQEEEWEGSCCGENGDSIPKHWHIFRVLARKMAQ